jgi:hypothetical protein
MKFDFFPEKAHPAALNKTFCLSDVIGIFSKEKKLQDFLCFSCVLVHGIYA